MSEKDPPDSLGRRDRTIIVPNPGGRRPEAFTPAAPPSAAPPPRPAFSAAAPEASPDDEWIKGRRPDPTPQSPERREFQIEDLLVPNENPILRSAGPLLLLLGRLRVAQLQASPASLMGQVAESMVFFDKEIRSAGVSPEHASVAKYILCATADDIVQNIPTEDRHVWTQYSMLSRFFGERIGGVRFFAELDKAKTDPLNNYSVLELIYVCLALGFQGVHRSSSTGAASLQQIQRDLYEILRRVRPRFDRDLSPHWLGQDLPREALRSRVPFWTVAGAAALLLFALFITLRAFLSDGAELAAADLSGLHGREKLNLVRSKPAPQPKIAEPQPCTGLAQDDNIHCVRNGIVTTITVGSSILFEPGDDRIKPEFQKISNKISQYLEKSPGAVTVVGHTDNVPLRKTSRFAGNYELSVARAKAVIATLKPGLTDPQRLNPPVGKGEREPTASNGTRDGQAKNRRVEIFLTRSE